MAHVTSRRPPPRAAHHHPLQTTPRPGGKEGAGQAGRRQAGEEARFKQQPDEEVGFRQHMSVPALLLTIPHRHPAAGTAGCTAAPHTARQAGRHGWHRCLPIHSKHPSSSLADRSLCMREKEINKSAVLLSLHMLFPQALTAGACSSSYKSFMSLPDSTWRV